MFVWGRAFLFFCYGDTREHEKLSRSNNKRVEITRERVRVREREKNNLRRKIKSGNIMKHTQASEAAKRGSLWRAHGTLAAAAERGMYLVSKHTTSVISPERND